jgi:hypothetical protein
MGTILKVIILSGLVWGYFVCLQSLSNKALTQLNEISKMYSVENIQTRLIDVK